MVFLSVCAVIKWEWPWLVEWVEYYRVLGVEHFYIYCNEEDTLKSREILRPYIDAGIMSFFKVTVCKPQVLCLNDAVELTRKRSQWLAMVDLDEFVWTLDGSSFYSALSEYSKYAALAINWRCFGSSNLMLRPDSQINCFLWRAPDNFGGNVHVKLICQPRFVQNVLGPHCCEAKEGYGVVNENFESVGGSLSEFTARRFIVNHYVVRSRQDFVEVKTRRGRVSGASPYDEWFWQCYDVNSVFDDELFRRIPYDVGKKKFGPTVNLNMGVSDVELAKYSGQEVVFDDEFYLLAHPDVAEGVVKGYFCSGFDHFLRHGAREGRRARFLRSCF